MKTQHRLLTAKEVVRVLVDREVTPEKIAEVLLIPRYWTTETPLIEDTPTMLFEDLMKITGYELHYQESSGAYENEHWLTKLEN